MTTLLLVRHGETDWNRDGRVQGHADTPLNEAGRAQVRLLADRLVDEPFDAVYSSDLSRARETAEILAAGLGLDVVELPELREKNFGSWEGLTDVEILERFPDAQRGHWGDGESADELSARVEEALHRIAGSHPDGRVLVVTHGGPLRAMLRRCASDHDGPLANCHAVRIAIEDGDLREVH